MHKLVKENQELKKASAMVIPEICTLIEHGSKVTVQELFTCATCSFGSDKALCKPCIQRCHRGCNTKSIGLAGIHDETIVVETWDIAGRYGPWKHFKQFVMGLNDERQERLLSW